MTRLLDFPMVILALSFCALVLCTALGVRVVGSYAPHDEKRADLDLVLTATMTLLALLISFSFAMAVNRYDQRKACEATEANAIGTEYTRAGLLAAADAEHVRSLLKVYLDRRILFFSTRGPLAQRQLGAQTADLQRQLWSAVAAAGDRPAPLLALVAAGMNDVLNSQAYTQAAFWNRIPYGAWVLMALIAMVGNVMFGYAIRSFQARAVLFILPLVVSLALFLIADIDSPRGGVIRVAPHNLLSLAEQLP